MGIPIGQYDREIIRRTKELIETYDGEFTITLLMNSLLSLIVLPKEFSKDRNMKFLDDLIVDVEVIKTVISKKDFMFKEGVYSKKGKPDVPNPRNLDNLLRKIRNGISHQHITPISGGLNKWTGVILEDFNSNHSKGLHIEFKIAELKEFALYVADSYLKGLPNN